MEPALQLSELNLNQWSDWKWRLSNIYYIVTDEGKKVKFNPNPEQLDLIGNLWYLNIILKARQLGFTTLIDILGLDQTIFNNNYSTGIIAHSIDDMRKIFRNKVKFPYDNLPEALRNARPLETDTANELVFGNGSSIAVSTSMRSGTLQFLHVSEFGKICRKYPEKAREIVTGSFNTVKAGQFILIESTAEGRGGYFYTYCKRSQALAEEIEAGTKKLTELDFRFHFYPWWNKPSYQLDPEAVVITDHYKKYFMDLEVDHDITLTPGQRAWYVKKAEMLKMDEGKIDEDMKREFPSYPEEAFEVAVMGAYYREQMAYLRKNGRIRNVPHLVSMPVNTFWDLGRNDANAIWFHQFIAGEHRFFHYMENSGEDLAYYYRYMQNDMKGCIWGKHYLPHDAENKNLERNESRVDRLIELGIPSAKIVVVPKIDNIHTGIELTRRALLGVWIDDEWGAGGINALDNYQAEFDEKLGTYKLTPLHNWASNGADAFRQFAQGWEVPVKKSGKKKPRNWRTL